MALPDVVTPGARPEGVAPSVLVIGCGALARELLDIVAANRIPNIRVECLPAILHNRPEKIPGAVRARLESARDYDRVYVAYGDCGTGGLLDDVLEEFGVERLPGAHCYQFYAGIDVFDRLHEDEPGTLYLTDYLARHFDRIVWQGLGLDRWPELRDDYFGNYVRVVYLSQTTDPTLAEKARAAADRLGLVFESRHVGYGEVERSLVRLSVSPGALLPVSSPSGGSTGASRGGGKMEPPVAPLLGEETVAPLRGKETS